MSNDAMKAQWNNVAGPEWVRNERLYDRMLEPLGGEVMRVAAIRPNETVLDVGCGFGTLSAAALKAIGPTGRVRGVDISAPMIERARIRVPNAGFAVTDAQVDELGGPYDVLISRFGVMFFADPEAAFANMRRAMEPGGRLAFVCWRPMSDNPIFTVGTRPMALALANPPQRPPAGAPGPFGFADGERTAKLLSNAGWSAVDVSPFDCLARFDLNGGNGIAERIEMLRSSETGRTLIEEAPDRADEVFEAVRAELHEHLTGGVLQLSAATWIVTARA